MNVSYLCPIFCKGINNLKHTNLSKLYVKSLYKVRVELPLFFSMASEGMRNDGQRYVTFRTQGPTLNIHELF